MLFDGGRVGGVGATLAGGATGGGGKNDGGFGVAGKTSLVWGLGVGYSGVAARTVTVAVPLPLHG